MKSRAITLIILLLLVQCKGKQVTFEEPSRFEILLKYFSQTDGEITYTAVEVVYAELEFHPIEVLDAMSKDSIALNHFLHTVHFVFVDWDNCGKVEAMEGLLKQDIEMLKTLVVKQELAETRERLVQAMEKIRPHEIN